MATLGALNSAVEITTPDIKTTGFTASLGGRYVCRGTFTITDPSGTTAGQIYQVIVSSGAITIGGVVYYPSSSTITREYNGSGWTTLNQAGVRVTKTTGSTFWYAPTADTDTARGLALEAAFAIAEAGDTIDLSPGNYLITKEYNATSVGGVVTQFSILDKMTIRLNGARLYKTSAALTAGSFVVGKYYTIITQGTTDFTLIGAANNNSNTTFLATGAGSGNGTAIPSATTMFSTPYSSGFLGSNDWSILGPGTIEGTTATTAGTGYGNEIGINLVSCRRWKIENVSIIKFRGTGLQANNANFTGDALGYGTYKFSTGHVSSCNFDLNNIGMANYAGNEYIAFTNCSFNQNLTGCDVYAGNTKFIGCEASLNTNQALRIRDGGNDGHGCWVGGWLTHNAGFAVTTEANMDNGFLIIGTVIAGDSNSTNKIQALGGGLTIQGCFIDAPFYASGTPTGLNTMKGCFLPGTYTVITDLSAAERAKWKFLLNDTLTGPWSNNDVAEKILTTTATSYTVLLTDEIIAVTDTSSARDITLPDATLASKRLFIVKDESGVAGTNNITVKATAGTLDGVAAATGVPITTNYGKASWYSNGTNWFSA